MTEGTVIITELGMFHFERIKTRGSRKDNLKVRGMPRKRLPAIAKRAIWEKVTKGRTGKKWSNVVDDVWKEIEGNQNEILSYTRSLGV